MNGWPFGDPENVATITVRQIVHDGRAILFVSHDADDGMWQFLTGDPVEMADALLVSFREIHQLDPSIADLADLPVGWHASRESPQHPWVRYAAEQSPN